MILTGFTHYLQLFREPVFIRLPFDIEPRWPRFFKRFPARRNRTVHSGLILELFAQWVIYFDWKKKIRRIGGCKGRPPRVYLTLYDMKTTLFLWPFKILFAYIYVVLAVVWKWRVKSCRLKKGNDEHSCGTIIHRKEKEDKQVCIFPDIDSHREKSIQQKFH